MPSSCPLHPERRVETFFFSIRTNPIPFARADGREPALGEVEGDLTSACTYNVVEQCVG